MNFSEFKYYKLEPGPFFRRRGKKESVFTESFRFSCWLVDVTLDDDLKLILDLLAQERLVVIENCINGVAIKDTDNI